MQSIVGQGNRLCVKGIRLDDIGARLEILAVNCFDGLGLSQAEHVMQPAEIPGPFLESLTAIGLLVETLLVDHGTHRAIEDDNALAQKALKCLNSLPHRVHCAGKKLLEAMLRFKLKINVS